MMRSPKLEHVLTQKQISDQMINQPCKQEHISEISLQITDWQTIAEFLELTEVEKEEIENDQRSTKHKRIAMFRKWKQKFGMRATYGKLMIALNRCNQIGTIEMICDMLKQSEIQSNSEHNDVDQAHQVSKMFCENEPTLTLQASNTFLDDYCTQIKKHYERILQNPSVLIVWPYLPTFTYITLAMILEEKVRYGRVDDEFVRMTIHGQVDDILRKKVPVELEDIFTLDKKQRKMILIEGAPGSGKSTLALHICDQWRMGKLFSDFIAVILVQLRDLDVQSAQSLADILPPSEQEKAAAEFIANKGHKILFLLDGWDELAPALQEKSLFVKLIKEPHKLSLHESAVIVTSRPVSSETLHPVATTRIEVVGFRSLHVKQYFKKCLKVEDVQKLLIAVKMNPMVESTCYLPLNAAIIVFLFLEGNRELPSTYHGLFTELVYQCIRRYIKKQAEQGNHIPEPSSLDNLPPSINDLFKHMCFLAYYGIQQNIYVFTTEKLKELDIPTRLDHLGLMQMIPSLIRAEHWTYNFLHLSVQELLAAIYISHLPECEQINCFKELFGRPRFMTVFQYYAGLTHLEAEGLNDAIFTLIYNRRKGKRTRVGLLRCLYGAQVPTLCCTFPLMYRRNTLHLMSAKDPVDSLAIGYFLTSFCLHRTGEFRLKLRRLGIDDQRVKCLTSELLKFCPKKTEKHGYLQADLCGNDIRGVGATYIAKLLKANNIIHKLNLAENSIQQGKKDGFVELVTALSTTDSLLTDLNISSCSVTITEDTGPTIADMLRKNKSLKRLQMSFNDNIKDLGISHISHGLARNSTLTVLNLDKTGLTSKAMRDLGNALAHNTALVSLHMSWNQIGDDGVSFIVEAVSSNSNTNLRDLRLCCCGITAEGAKGLSIVISRTRLKVLYLSMNDVADDGVEFIANALTQNVHLSVLYLRKANVADRGIKALSSALQINKASLQVLDLQENNITDSGLLLLGSMLKHNQKLHRLHLLNSLKAVSAETISTFGLYLQENECLRNVMLSKHHCEMLQDRLELLNEARSKKQRTKLKLIFHSTKLRKLQN